LLPLLGHEDDIIVDMDEMHAKLNKKEMSKNGTMCSPSTFDYGRTTMAMNPQTRKGLAGGNVSSRGLQEEFLKLGATLTVVLVCFAQGIGTYI
jgi:hypothetical protein